jgi:hypothetical protein
VRSNQLSYGPTKSAMTLYIKWDDFVKNGLYYFLILRERRAMIPVNVLTLIAASAPRPSVLVLQTVPENQQVSPVLIPVYINLNEASLLSLILKDAQLTRPTSHQLFYNICSTCEVAIQYVHIYKLLGCIFYTKLVVKHNNKIQEFEARPSDAIALAVQQGAPLFIEEALVNSAGFSCALPHETMDAALQEFSTWLDKTSPEDFSD